MEHSCGNLHIDKAGKMGTAPTVNVNWHNDLQGSAATLLHFKIHITFDQ